MGPSALRVASLNRRVAALGYEVEDLGNVPVEQAESGARRSGQMPGILPQIAATCTRLAGEVERALERGQVPRGAGRRPFRRHRHRRRSLAPLPQGGQKIGLIWLDAHADMNTPDTSPSGNVHGMPLACCVGHGPAELTRDLRLRAQGGSAQRRHRRTARRGRAREAPRARFRRAGLHHAGHRRARPARRHARRHPRRLRRHRRLPPFVRHGLRATRRTRPASARRCAAASPTAKRIWQWRWSAIRGAMASLEVVEVNPVIDEVNRTADLAVELLMSGLGKRILMKLRVAVIYGGRSGEHEISVRSAEAIMARAGPCQVRGRAIFHRQRRASGARKPFCPNRARTPASTWSSRCCTAPSARTAPCRACSNWPTCPTSARACSASAVSMDKEMMKRVCAERVLPVVDYVTVTRGQPGHRGPRSSACPSPCSSSPPIWARRWAFPRRTTARNWKPPSQLAAQYDRKIIVERGIVGPRARVLRAGQR